MMKIILVQTKNLVFSIHFILFSVFAISKALDILHILLKNILRFEDKPSQMIKKC